VGASSRPYVSIPYAVALRVSLCCVHKLSHLIASVPLRHEPAEEGSLQSELSPCYLNRMDVSEVAVGWGKYTLELLRDIINRFSPFRTGYPLELVNCFAPPTKEYVFPKDLYPFE
jgi:hypothetical protein